MNDQCPNCLRKSNVSMKNWNKEKLSVNYFCSKCKKYFTIKYECEKCNHDSNNYKVHCKNDHRFSIYHNCKLRKMGEIEKT